MSESSLNDLLSAALEATGFVICQFPADASECDKCDMPHKQHYYRRTSVEIDEGEYFCAECVVSEHTDMLKSEEEFSR